MGSTYKSADEILVTTQETMENIPYRFRHKARVCQAVGIDAEDFNGSSVARVPDSSRLELLFVGRLLPWKGVHLLLQALSRDGLRDRQVRLTIIGSGPDRKRLDRLVNDLALQDKVHWIPWIPREELVRIYPKYDVFAFSSLHDSGGAAVLEAMANGLPVVCLDLGGPGVIVSNQCGRVVNTCASGEDQVVARLSRALEELDADRTLLSRLSAGASERVLHLSWRANVVTAHGNRWTRQSHPAENNSTLISSCSN
jgi:glycosyltransferase involved in cell wall biosynthesis